MTPKVQTLSMIDILPSAQTGHVTRARSFTLAGLCVAMGLGLLAGCAADRPLRTPDVGEAVRADLFPAVAPKSVAVPSRISDALAEPAPPAVPLAPEPKLDLLVNNAQAREVFLAIVTDTRYSMLLHPDVAGTLSVTLRGVSVIEALEAIRDVYGYDFKVEGRRITIYGPTLQTRIFTINYLNATRDGKSDLRVSSSAMPASGYGSASGSSALAGQSQIESSSVTTLSQTDLWEELTASVCSIIGAQAAGACMPKTSMQTKQLSNSPVLGQSTTTLNSTDSRTKSGFGIDRRVTTSPQAGLMVVRAMPEELREVEKFLKAAQVSVDRQVMLEAKIVAVELRDGFQSGIDWSALKIGRNATGAMGVLSGNTSSNTLVSGVQANLPGFAGVATSLLADAVSLPAAGAGLFGLAFAASGFQAVLGFLETQGDVQILSSPRIATLNNQKALLKVGTDEYYVTGFSPSNTTSNNTTGGTNAATTNSSSLPVLSPLFSGIALDVMPQIDAANNITLHIRPSVTSILEKNLQIGLGTTGNFQLPLASRVVNETDTIVRIQDGNIVAIGGLMQIESNRRSSGLPGTGNIPLLSTLLGNHANIGRKKEVVVLIKPTIIRTAQDWETQTSRTRAALDDMDAARARVIRIDGTVQDNKSKSQVQ